MLIILGIRIRTTTAEYKTKNSRSNKPITEETKEETNKQKMIITIQKKTYVCT